MTWKKVVQRLGSGCCPACQNPGFNFQKGANPRDDEVAAIECPACGWKGLLRELAIVVDPIPMKTAKPPDIPPKVALGFAIAMKDYFAETDPHKQDAIAAHQLSVLREYQGAGEKPLRLEDIKGMFAEMKKVVDSRKAAPRLQ